mmetsp:Transcript_90987/g.202019  ORF Transcript_90987/g.202019 Transcript_90987/m.202019 type:complete len:211 (-) Transcript_90987:746-1378(-)
MPNVRCTKHDTQCLLLILRIRKRIEEVLRAVECIQPQTEICKCLKMILRVRGQDQGNDQLSHLSVPLRGELPEEPSASGCPRLSLARHHAGIAALVRIKNAKQGRGVVVLKDALVIVHESKRVLRLDEELTIAPKMAEVVPQGRHYHRHAFRVRELAAAPEPAAMAQEIHGVAHVGGMHLSVVGVLCRVAVVQQADELVQLISFDRAENF